MPTTDRGEKEGDPKEGELSAPQLLRWYLSLFKGNWWRVAGGVALTLCQSLAVVPIPLLLRKIVDVDLPKGDTRGLILSGAGALGLYLSHAVFLFAGRSLTLLATKNVTEQLRARLCMQLQQLSLKFYDREKASELHARVVIDTERIDIMGNSVVTHGVASGILFVFAVVLLSVLNWRLFLVTLAVLPLFYLAHRIMKPRMHKTFKNFRDGMETMSSQVNDLLQSIRLVKSFAREQHEQGRAEDQFRSVTRHALAMTILGSFYESLMGFLSNTTVVLMYVVGGLFILRGHMTLGDIIAFTGMVGFLINPINAMMVMVTQVYAGVASLRPVHKLLTLDDPLERYKGKTVPTAIRGSVAFDRVTFKYDSTGKHALIDVTTDIAPGETVALVGESGAGKSTFANLVLGFYFPEQGRVLIDGKDVRDLNLRALREQIGVVSQDNVLLNTSIRDNLLYGRMTANQDEIEEACRNANALEFIEKIPDKFAAVVGDRGVKLSGGQRQRLAIARALLKNPRILILDEATSALDSESEGKIQEALERLRANRTCLIIAHRLSTVMSSDRILVFRDGYLVEAGRHDELQSRHGEYARLSRRQFRTVGVEA